MPKSRDCDFCGSDIEPGTGTMFVAVNGSVTHFCSSKCEKNAALDREARDHEWTAAGQRVRPETTASVEATEADEAAAESTREESTTETEPTGADEPPAPPAETGDDSGTASNVTPDLATVEGETQVGDKPDVAPEASTGDTDVDNQEPDSDDQAETDNEEESTEE